MARNEQDREDLLREATALVERVELMLPSHPEPVVVGFRTGGAMSIYFGADPVYHFTADGKLRRAFIAKLLYKAVGGKLVEMRRQRIDGEVRLVSRQLTEAAQNERIDDLGNLLTDLFACLRHSNYHLVGQVPEDAKLIERIKKWGDQMNEILVADAAGLR